MACVETQHDKTERWDSTETDVETGKVSDLGATQDRSPEVQRSRFAGLQAFAGRCGVEQRGIERVPNSERTDSNASQIGIMWFSVNMAVSSFTIGTIAIPIFNLGYIDSALIIVFVNIIAILPVCFFSTFGPRFGLRQMVLSRFYFGYHGAKLVACLNILACIGWAAVNIIVGAQLIHAINPAVPGYAGILIIALSTLVVCAFGYRLVHVYERWSWIPCFAIFLVVLATFAHSGHFDTAAIVTSPGEKVSSVLSFAASVFGFATAWTTLAADYTVYQPANRPRSPVFFWTFAGLLLSLIFTELLGAAVATAIIASPEGSYGDAYATSGVGGLLAQTLVPHLGRFGEFCVVVLALSVVANNCPNVYSVSLSLQVLARPTERVPRFVWAAVGTAVYIAVAIPGYDHFESALQKFLLLISYWLAIYEGVALTEHFAFRRGLDGYQSDDYAAPSRLPPSFAAIAASAIGVVGAVLGAAQVWFVGPIGRLCGADFGGDVGFELAFSFTAVSYLGLRSLEKRYFGR